MADNPTHYRSFEDLIGGPGPGGGIGGVDWLESIRHQAVAEVLRRLPEAAYEALKEKEFTFSWFIPEEEMYGGGWPFPGAEYEEESLPGVELWEAGVLYLSPLLERRPWPFVVAVVAHELAHIILGHRLRTHPDEYEVQEREVGENLEAWGFGAEWRYHQARVRRREREKERVLQALIAAAEAAQP